VLSTIPFFNYYTGVGKIGLVEAANSQSKIVVKIYDSELSA
jgi:hypothetical protein